MCTFEQLQTANKEIKTTAIKGKDYAEVNQRIKVFRMLFPMGSIQTELVSDNGEKCVFKAIVSTDDGKILGTGTAFEMKNSSNVNKTSYIENCETSAVGRALAMCGIGIDISVASAEEVTNAMNNQDKGTDKEEPNKHSQEQLAIDSRETTREDMLEVISKKYPAGPTLNQLLGYFGVDSLDKLSTAQICATYDRCKK